MPYVPRTEENVCTRTSAGCDRFTLDIDLNVDGFWVNSTGNCLLLELRALLVAPELPLKSSLGDVGAHVHCNICFYINLTVPH